MWWSKIATKPSCLETVSTEYIQLIPLLWSTVDEDTLVVRLEENPCTCTILPSELYTYLNMLYPCINVSYIDHIAQRGNRPIHLAHPISAHIVPRGHRC